MAVKNINYDLVKLLHSKMDNAWRLEKFYCGDAKEAKCHSYEGLKQMLDDEKRHIELLTKEIKMRLDAGLFN